MSDAEKAIVDGLTSKVKELTEEREDVRRSLLENALRDAQIERDINGCIAAARAFEQEIELPKNPPVPPNLQGHLNAFVAGRNQIAASAPALKTYFGLTDGDIEPETLSGESAVPEMPRIADIILDRLKVAGKEGSKASEIRRYISRTYKADIHEKTVGMTLYRLKQDETVRNEGHKWFLASTEAKNPGGETPGSINSAKT